MMDIPHDGTISLGELVAVPDLHVDTLTVPLDAERRIRYVYPTELADPSMYLRGEELILSVGVPVADQPVAGIRRYVRGLKQHGVTALVIGLGDIFAAPPAPLVDECRAADLPLLTQQPTVPFRRIVDWNDARRASDREIDASERDLGSKLRWFIAGTLGLGPVEAALSGFGLGAHPVAVCSFPIELHSKVHPLVDRHVAAIAALEGQVVALCEHTAEFSAELTASNLVCGIAIAPNAQAMSHAIPESLEALAEGVRRKGTVRIDDIATLDGLLAAVPKVRLVPFVHRLLSPLVEYDKEHGTELMPSLEAFLRAGVDIGGAAAQLYVHVNTLRNRLSKIAELTDANPLDESHRVNFRIALWAARNMGLARLSPPHPGLE